MVRQHTRHALAVDALVRVAPCSRASVRWSPQAGVAERGFVARVTDLGLGGMGLASPLYVPRRTVLLVTLVDRSDGDCAVLLEAEVRVQRVSTGDRAPTYLLGVAYTARTDELEQKTSELIARLEAAAKGAAA